MPEIPSPDQPVHPFIGIDGSFISPDGTEANTGNIPPAPAIITNGSNATAETSNPTDKPVQLREPGTEVDASGFGRHPGHFDM